MFTNIFRIITTALLAVGLLVSGFTASAATIYMNPAAQTLPDGATFYVDILASGLPVGTSGGALDISWTAADMTLNSVYVATTAPSDSNGGQFPGLWNSVSSLLSGPGTIGAGSLTGLFVGSFDGLSGDQPIARLNFTLAAGVSNSQISMTQAAVDGTWSAYDPANPPPYNFTNTYSGAIINPTAIPVPAALWLFGSGLFGLAGAAARRRV
jgi:hypothetical protein